MSVIAPISDPTRTSHDVSEVPLADVVLNHVRILVQVSEGVAS